MNEKYKRRFTPQTREHKTKGLPQIGQAKINLSDDIDFRMGNYVMSAKKSSNFMDMQHSKQPMSSSKLRERSAGPRIDIAGDGKPFPAKSEPQTSLMPQREYLASFGGRDNGLPGKAAMSYTSNFGMMNFSATKKTSNSRAQNEKFYSSYMQDPLQAPITAHGWSNAAGKQNFSIKTDPLKQQNLLIPNKSAVQLMNNTIQVKTLTGSKMRPSNMKGYSSMGKTLGGTNGPVRPSQKTYPRSIPKLEPPRTSSSSFHVIKSYAVNTCKGLVRPYNEDRVSIILNMLKPESKRCKRWPVCSFFGVRCLLAGVRWPRRQCLL